MADIFGQALAGWQAGDRETPLIVWRDDGHGYQQGPGMWFADRLWPAEAAVAGEAAGRILDVGCGAGRHLLHFQRKGHAVTGIDASPLAARICRARGGREVLAGDVLMARLPEAAFDTALLFGNNIGLGGTPGGVHRLLRKLRRAVTGAVLVTSQDVTQGGEAKHRAYVERNRLAGKPPGTMRIRLEYGAEDGDWFEWLHPTPDELGGLARAAGWRLAALERFRHGGYAAVLRPLDG